MPSTVNGIGTTYFLKQNRQIEEAQCPHCNNYVKLESYETWYCICVLFIPVLPLGKKQILNYCPVCTRHQVIKSSEWEKLRTAAISETSEEFAEAKDNPEAAIKMHGTLLAFQKGAEADRLAEIMLNRFGEMPQVQFYLGACFERLGRKERANTCFLKAFELAPTELPMRRAAALVLMEQNKPDEAKPLLDAFGPDTPAFELALFFVLAKAYQRADRHAEALDIYKMLLQKQPGIAMDKEFAKSVRTSEKALGVEKPTLPPDPWYRKSGIVWSLIAAGVVASLGGWNYYVAQHRTLNIVNGLKQPITVQIDQLPPVQVPGRGKQTLTIAEGHHEAEVTEPAGRFPKSQFELQSSWWERFFRTPVFVADPSRSAAVEWEQTVYSDVKVPGDVDNKVELRIGQTFSSFPNVDFPFEPFPQQVKAKRGSRILKSRVDLLQEEPTAILNGAFAMGQDVSQIDDFLENHLLSNPDDSDLLRAYLGIGAMQGNMGRRQEFLGQHLADRPIRITWHRRYQDSFGIDRNLANAKAKHAELVARYDELLKQNPKDPALLYLRSRLESHARGSLPLLNQALEIDPQHAFATGAKAYSYLVTGQNDLALEWYRKAVALAGQDPEFATLLTNAQFAAKDFASLENSLREALKTNPENQETNLELLKILILTMRGDEAERDYQALQQRIQQKIQGIGTLISMTVRNLELPYLYAKKDFDNLSARARQAGSETQEFEFAATLERGQLMEVPSSTLPNVAPYWHLCRFLVAQQLGDAAAAEASKAAALKLLEAKGDEEGIAGELLRQGTEAKWEEVEDLLLQPQLKAVLLVALAHGAPPIKTQCLELAEKLNHSLNFPYHLLQKEITRLRQP